MDDRETAEAVLRDAIEPALALLPAHLAIDKARVIMLAIGLQESDLRVRRQFGNGPARGLWQFEQGTQASRGGVWGVYLHQASRELLQALCKARDVPFEPRAIWAQLEHDDILAAGVARLLLLTDAQKLPELGDAAGAWALYAERTWRPGKPHPDEWGDNYAVALAVVAL